MGLSTFNLFLLQRLAVDKRERQNKFTDFPFRVFF